MKSLVVNTSSAAGPPRPSRHSSYFQIERDHVAGRGSVMGGQGSVDWERDIYGKGKQLNLWPYSVVVSAFSRIRSEWSKDRQPRVLELGSGAGNNLWLLGNLGFDVVGIEQSETAVDFARRRLADLGLTARIEIGDMSEMPFEDREFDFVLDRASITQVEADKVPNVSDEIYRVLRSPGRLL